MKKRLIIILVAAILLVITAMFAGCTSTSSPAETPSAIPSEIPPETTEGEDKIDPPPTTTLPEVTEENWWSQDMDCSGCHAGHVESMTDSSLLAYAHAQAGLDQCLACHELADLEEAHDRPATVPDFIARQYSQDSCLKCHGTYESLAELTADSTIFEKPDGSFANPHQWQGEPHEENIECYNCHKIHIEWDTTRYCYSCHHTEDLECYTCH